MLTNNHHNGKKDLASTVTKISLTALVLFALYKGIKIILLVFAGILLGILLDSLSKFFVKYARMPRWLAMTTSVLFFFLFVGGLGWLIIPNIIIQFGSLIKEMPDLISNIDRQIDANPVFKNSSVNVESFLQNFGTTASSFATGLISSAAELITALFIIISIGIYSAAEPNIYKNGIIALFPKNKRERMSQVYDELGKTLKHWLVGDFFGMLVIGSLTTAALTFLKVPYALSLGMIAGILNIIPNIGPIMSVVPALIISFGDSGLEKAVSIMVTYTLIQYLESYVTTPMIQKRMVHLPPVLIIIAEIVFTAIAGGLGLFLATPTAAVILVLVNKLYVEDILEKGEHQNST